MTDHRSFGLLRPLTGRLAADNSILGGRDGFFGRFESDLINCIAAPRAEATNLALLEEAVESSFSARLCVPASRPGSGATAEYFELRLLKARLSAAVDLLNDTGEEIDLEEIESNLQGGLSGVTFVACRPGNTGFGHARRRFKRIVLKLEQRALKAAVMSLNNPKDHDGDGLISTVPPHVD